MISAEMLHHRARRGDDAWLWTGWWGVLALRRVDGRTIGPHPHIGPWLGPHQAWAWVHAMDAPQLWQPPKFQYREPPPPDMTAQALRRKWVELTGTRAQTLAGLRRAAMRFITERRRPVWEEQPYRYVPRTHKTRAQNGPRMAVISGSKARLDGMTVTCGVWPSGLVVWGDVRPFKAGDWWVVGMWQLMRYAAKPPGGPWVWAHAQCDWVPAVRKPVAVFYAETLQAVPGWSGPKGRRGGWSVWVAAGGYAVACRKGKVRLAGRVAVPADLQPMSRDKMASILRRVGDMPNPFGARNCLANWEGVVRGCLDNGTLVTWMAGDAVKARLMAMEVRNDDGGAGV